LSRAPPEPLCEAQLWRTGLEGSNHDHLFHAKFFTSVKRHNHLVVSGEPIKLIEKFPSFRLHYRNIWISAGKRLHGVHRLPESKREKLDIPINVSTQQICASISGNIPKFRKDSSCEMLLVRNGIFVSSLTTPYTKDHGEPLSALRLTLAGGYSVDGKALNIGLGLPVARACESTDFPYPDRAAPAVCQTTFVGMVSR